MCFVVLLENNILTTTAHIRNLLSFKFSTLLPIISEPGLKLNQFLLPTARTIIILEPSMKERVEV